MPVANLSLHTANIQKNSDKKNLVLGCNDGFVCSYSGGLRYSIVGSGYRGKSSGGSPGVVVLLVILI